MLPRISDVWKLSKKYELYPIIKTQFHIYALNFDVLFPLDYLIYKDKQHINALLMSRVFYKGKVS